MFDMYNGDGYAYAAMAGGTCRCSGRVFRTECGGGKPWEEFVIGSNRWVMTPDRCYDDGYRLIDPLTAGQLISVRTVMLRRAVNDATRLAKQTGQSRMLSVGSGGRMRYTNAISTERIALVADACADLDAKAAAWLHGACLAGVSAGKLTQIGFPSDIVGAVRILADGMPEDGRQSDSGHGMIAAEERIAEEVITAWTLRCPSILAIENDSGMQEAATA